MRFNPMMRSPSLKGFMVDTINRLKRVRYGGNILHKFNIFTCAILYSIPNIVRAHFSRFDKECKKLCAVLVKRTIVNVNGIRFALIDAESLSIVLPEYEEWMWDYLKVNRGDVFVDVGAHIGKYALQIARTVGENGVVIAIEPNARNYEILLKNIHANKIGNILTFNIAAWNKNCKKELFISNFGGQHSLKRNQGFGSVIVQARALDNTIKGTNVNWIKIDVEGAEFEVLQGLENTLKKCHPKLIIETSKTNLEVVKRFIVQLGYVVAPTPQSDRYIYCSWRKQKGCA